MSRNSQLSILALFLAALGLTLAQPTPTDAQKAAVEVGRYQTLAEGSRARLYSIAVRIDSMTGKAWRTVIQGQQTDAWVEIEEPAGETLPAGGIGHYQIDAAYVGDNLGQELPAVIRTDTSTGKSWMVRVEPPRWRWMPIKEAAAK